MERPRCYSPLALHLLLCLFSLRACSAASITAGTPDESELWGYVEVRPKAHLFWWYYKSPQKTSTPSKPWPTVLWLQGGPGASGVGLGNFLEMGPLDVDLKPRNSTWLHKADLIFVDNPVGTGYSYVEDDSLFVTSDWQQAADMTTVVRALAKEVPTLASSPLFLVAESYGGKYAATLGASIARAVRAGELNVTLGGVAVGDSWISPEDFTLSYTPLLLSVSRLDDNAGDEANNLQAMKYSTYGQDSQPGSNTIDGIMNGVIKQKLKIIPKNFTWGEQSDSVYNALVNDFMKPKIDEIDELLSYGINVTVYNGQLDVICSTNGAEAWVQKLKWDGLRTFLSLPRQPLYCGASKGTKAFVRSHKNLHFYWILGAGHYVPADQPCIALSMISSITQSPAS
ncbi:Serine carboxypeptidase-like 51 [Zea mays]|uniref:Carboxypeptidase n=1 Tax=Zea mays TaxID=4577 RepID=A0A1D6K4Y9_MAIZE|nr:Serine carboxypeptidase-like 51 [Zea mays]